VNSGPRSACYPHDVDFFHRERGFGLDDKEEEDEDEVHDNLEEEEELQPADLTEEDIEMAISQSKLDQLAQWDGIAIQLWASA
jgi:hypothetical protein